VYCVSVASQKSAGRLSNGIRTKKIQKIEREKNRKQKRMHYINNVEDSKH
jgi:hypothetical protein